MLTSAALRSKSGRALKSGAGDHRMHWLSPFPLDQIVEWRGVDYCVSDNVLTIADVRFSSRQDVSHMRVATEGGQ